MNPVALKPVREYMTDFQKRRSIIALCCALLSLILAFCGIIAGVDRTIVRWGKRGFDAFIYFTMISNTLAALSSAFVIPYAVEGIRRKRFTMPKWIAVLHYLAASSVAVVMVFVFAFVSWAAPESAFGGSNFILHVICPPLILFSFFQIENGYIYTLKDMLLGVLPLSVYTAVYFVEVALIGELNGGWPDIYYILDHLPAAAAILLMLGFGFAVSSVIALIFNRLTKKRKEKMYQFWREDMDPVEVRIEAYGFGVKAGLNGEKNGIRIPFDILEDLAEKYQLDLDELIEPFFTGLQHGLKERERTRE